MATARHAPPAEISWSYRRLRRGLGLRHRGHLGLLAGVGSNLYEDEQKRRNHVQHLGSSDPGFNGSARPVLYLSGHHGSALYLWKFRSSGGENVPPALHPLEIALCARPWLAGTTGFASEIPVVTTAVVLRGEHSGSPFSCSWFVETPANILSGSGSLDLRVGRSERETSHG